MRLVLALASSSLEFGEPNSGGPFPYLLEVGALRTSARAGSAIGIAATEAPSVEVTLDNRGRKAAKIIGRPLRIGAEIYDDSDALFFSGTVSSIRYGARISLDLES